MVYTKIKIIPVTPIANYEQLLDLLTNSINIPIMNENGHILGIIDATKDFYELNDFMYGTALVSEWTMSQLDIPRYFWKNVEVQLNEDGSVKRILRVIHGKAE